MKMSVQTGKRKKTKNNKLKIPVCFLCEKSGKTKAFTKYTFLKCRHIVELRKALKYREIELPTSLHQKGYHVTCYNNFIGIKNDGIESITNSTQYDEQDRASEDTPASNTAYISKPRPIESIKAVLHEDLGIKETGLETQDIKKEFVASAPEIPAMENQFSMFTNYLEPDISKSVILKSILTRKSPVKKVMTHDSLAFTYEFADRASSNLTIENIQPKLVNATSISNKGVCIFCSKEHRKMGTRKEFLTQSEEDIYEKVLSWAQRLNDYDLMGKLKSSQTLLFHALCKAEYRYKLEKIKLNNCDDKDWLVIENLHTEAFDSLCAFIKDKIIDKRKTYFLSSLHGHYISMLHEIQNGTTPFNFDSYTPENLQEKLMNTYYGILEISTSKMFKRKVVYKSELKDNFDSEVVDDDDLKYDKLAYELRSVIKSVKRNGESVSVNNIPEKLFKFVSSLIQGPDVRTMNSTEDHVRIKSMCKDIVAQVIKED